MARYETTVLAEDLQPGDELRSAALGGLWCDVVDSVRVYPEGVEVRVGTERVLLCRAEVVTLLREERPRMATVTPLFAGIVDAARRMGR